MSEEKSPLPLPLPASHTLRPSHAATGAAVALGSASALTIAWVLALYKIAVPDALMEAWTVVLTIAWGLITHQCSKRGVQLDI